MSGRPLTHFDETGRARMVDVGNKAVTSRTAIATGMIRMQTETASLIREGRAAKGDVLAVAQVAAIMAAKRTSDVIPMCHPLMLSGVTVSFEIEDAAVQVRAQVKTTGQTGVEMEALTAVSVAALTIYDMVKAVDRGMTIGEICLQHKEGGASGTWDREDSPAS